jgi:hypothetical protein
MKMKYFIYRYRHIPLVFCLASVVSICADSLKFTATNTIMKKYKVQLFVFELFYKMDRNKESHPLEMA